MELSRQQKRKMQREINKARSKIESFTPSQIELIDKLINQGIDERVDELNDIYLICLHALFVELLPEKDLKDIQDIDGRFKDLCIEHARKYKKIIEGADSEMAKGKIESLNRKIENKAKELIKQGLKQKEIIETLKDEFHEASNAMISNIYKGIKSVVEAHEDDGEKALEYIFRDKTEINEIKVTNELIAKEELKKEIKLPEIPLENVSVPVKEIPRKSNLKITKKVVILEVEGKHGNYKYQDGKVEVYPNVEAIPKEKFNSIDEVQEYKREHLELIKSKYEEIETVFGLA